MPEEFKSYPKIFIYSIGMAGWSIMINIISVMIIYYYLPPLNSGLPVLIPQISIMGVFTMFSLVLASGRVLDAITDPLIAWISDRSTFRMGRRRPYMLLSLVPTLLFCILLFVPLKEGLSKGNYYWLFFMQAGFYFSITLYSVPFNALMPELARTKDQKLLFSTALSLMFVLGIIISSQIPFLADILKEHMQSHPLQRYYQYSIAITAGIGFLFMMIPVIFINEKKYCVAQPAQSGFKYSILSILRNKNFVIFLIADASFFVTLALISSGIIYFVSVLLGLSSSLGSRFLGLMIILSLTMYPFVVRLTRKVGKKSLIVFSFFLFALLFFIISGFGKFPIKPEYQLYILVILAAFPVAVLGILPFSIVAEIAEEDGLKSGEQKEGMFYAARTFSDKLGQTLGVMGFAIFTIFGKDIGDDLGIRLSALLGMGVCILAGIIFLFFKEIKKGSPVQELP
ncbi:MAG: MFS transporter [Bacteroidales bacterium]|nr:MFS transporter [Bacteroidales bacterium]